MKQTYTAHGLSMWIEATRATVLETNTTTSTSIHQDTGIPLYVPGVGSVQDKGPVYSTTTSTQKIWVRYPDGRDEELDHSLLDVSVRTGHELLLVKTGQEGTKGIVAAMHNINTGEARKIKASRQLSAVLDLNGDVAKFLRHLKWIVMACAPIAGYFVIKDLSAYPGGILGCLFMWALFTVLLAIVPCIVYSFYSNSQGWKKPAAAVCARVVEEFDKLCATAPRIADRGR